MENTNSKPIIIENVSFKQTNTTTIIEESAKLKIAKKLVEDNKKVIIRDIHPIILEVQKEYGNIFDYEII